MTLTVRELSEDQATGLVGREVERATLQQLLVEGGPLVVFVHGIAGVGKSTLVEAFASGARADGATVLRLDGGAIQPTERGFLNALQGAIGGELATAGAATSRLAGLSGRVVLILDTYELLRMLDPWFRQSFVPGLSENVRIVLAGREAPMTGWPSEFRGLFRAIPLGGLPSEDAETVLLQAGVDRADAARINQFAHGHPLSLRLAASALADRPEVSVEAVTVQAIVEELTELYLAGLDPLTRQALDAASVIRRPTLSLLAAMLPAAAPQDAFDRLRALPFVELADDGLVLHDTVREAVAALLRSSDPDRSRRYRTAAWRLLREEVGHASPLEMWRYTADLLFILENPVVRESFFPTTEHLYSVELARPDDQAAVFEIITRYEGQASVAAFGAWWRLAPESFRVARDRQGVVDGFYVITEMDRVSHRLVESDPVLAQMWEHLRDHPVPRGQRVLICRQWIARDYGEGPSPVQAAVWLDLKRYYMDLRPSLRRIYSTGRDLDTWGPKVASLGFELVPADPTDFDGSLYYATMLDFGPSSVDGWLSRVVANELQIEDDSMLDVVQRQLVLDGHRVDLTKLEFGVLDYLYRRRGTVVERTALLHDVWGYDDEGSNVIEAVVRSIRKKLGDRADMVETIRGIGYRFAAAD
jgi:hypothetical protein